MAQFSTGQIVFSKKGRDKGMAFVVISCEDEYVYIADGKLRTVSKPKKKKFKHIQPTNTVDAQIASIACSGQNMLDSDLRKAVERFEGESKAQNRL